MLRSGRVVTRAILITALCAIVGLPSSTQAGAKAKNYSRPLKLRTERPIKKLFPEYHGKYHPLEALIIEEFYPIGWSRDGKFAFYSEPGDEACDCYYARVRILDLVSDKVLWSFDYDSSEAEDSGRKKPPTTIKALWRENQKLFSAKLKEFGINAQGVPALMSFPITANGDRLKPDLRITENKNEETKLYGLVNEATVELTSRRYGKKVILNENFAKEGEAIPLGLKVLGYLKSPYEKRIGLVLIEVWRGYEGPPHTANIRLVGATLVGGFK